MKLKDTLIDIKGYGRSISEYYSDDCYLADITLGNDGGYFRIKAIRAGNLELWEIQVFSTQDVTVSLKYDAPYTAAWFTPVQTQHTMPALHNISGMCVYTCNIRYESKLDCDLTFSANIPYIGFAVFISTDFIEKHKHSIYWLDRFRPGISHNKSISATDAPLPACQEIEETLMKIAWKISSGATRPHHLEFDFEWLTLVALYDADVVFRRKRKNLTDADIRAAEQARAFLADNTHRPVAIAEVARAVGVSETRLKLIFKKAYDDTLYQYQLAMRVQKASTLLRKTDYSIKRISNITGFAGGAHFTQCFKQHTGRTPSEVRSYFSHLDM